MAILIKHVQGNVLRLNIPLTVKIRTIEGGEVVEHEEDFYPDTSKPITVSMVSSMGSKISFVPQVSGNVLTIRDSGLLKANMYGIEILCQDAEGNPYRYKANSAVQVVDATRDAGIVAGVEFDAEEYTLDGAVFISYGVEQVQSDWNEQDDESKAYIKNKPDLSVYATKEELREVEREIPTLPDHIVTDEHYVHTDNNYTSVEKEKLAGLENYDDSGIRQELDGKEDVATIVTPVNATDATLPITALTCEAGKYYRIDVAVDTLAVTLPAMTDLTTIRTVVIYLTAGTTPAVTITSADSKDVYYQDGFEIKAGSTYEINALFNGAAWIVAAVNINVE